MKKSLLFLVALTALVTGCMPGPAGEVVGVYPREEWVQVNPYGMNYVHFGSFTMGNNDRDLVGGITVKSKTVTISPFYIDQHEISNNEYRQFVFWVRDSLMREYLVKNPLEGQEDQVFGYDLVNGDPDLTKTQMEDAGIEIPEGVELSDYYTNYYRNFHRLDIKLNWESDASLQSIREIAFAHTDQPAGLEWFNGYYKQFYYNTEDGTKVMYDRNELDVSKLMYRYWWIDFYGAARKYDDFLTTDRNEGRNDEKNNGDVVELSGVDPDSRGDESERGKVNKLNQLHSVRIDNNRSKYLVEENIPIYPDTLVWTHDFTFSANNHLTETYFWHPAYDDYPVVGVTWGQCNAFCAWRTQILNDWKRSNGETFVQRFQLPSEAQWEWAARGNLANEEYPWGGPYTRNYLGCPLANFKPLRGDYPDDNGVHTVPIDSYSPNGWGLYNMAGNVAEWTNTSYNENGYQTYHDLNPELDYRAQVDDVPAQKRKVTRGGSWKDISYYIQCGSRSFEYQDTAKSYIGFRCIMMYLGRGKSGPQEDWNMPNE